MYDIAVILTDASRRILWVNEGFTKITGYLFAEVVGQVPGKILQGPKSEEESIEEIRNGLREMISFKSAITNYRKSGESYLCRLVIHPVFSENNELVNFIAFEVDGSKVSNTDDIPMMQLDEKYRSSSLRGLEEIRLFDQVRQLIEGENLFLDTHLTLKYLAQQLDTNTKYLSQAINHCSGQNFQQFINDYRIKEVKDRLQQRAHLQLTLFGVAQQCGFKNKSTFYKVFKEMTGQTPREFLELQGSANDY